MNGKSEKLMIWRGKLVRRLLYLHSNVTVLGDLQSMHNTSHKTLPRPAQKAYHAKWKSKHCYCNDHQMFCWRNTTAEGDAGIVTLMHCCFAVGTLDVIFGQLLHTCCCAHGVFWGFCQVGLQSHTLLGSPKCLQHCRSARKQSRGDLREAALVWPPNLLHQRRSLPAGHKCTCYITNSRFLRPVRKFIRCLPSSPLSAGWYHFSPSGIKPLLLRKA